MDGSGELPHVKYAVAVLDLFLGLGMPAVIL